MSKQLKHGTFIHGVAASEHLDSSGERVIIDGVDISSLTKDGVMNWEHQSKEASHIVGKVLEAKKIFKKSDCENDYHKYFWDKIQMPFIYVAGELFDHVGHSAAQDVAAMLKYDKNINKDETKALVNFSIEGSRLAKDGSNITKCIARKVSITITPCNKMAHAEHMEKPSKNKDSNTIDISKEILSKFKKSEEIAIEIIAKADSFDFQSNKKTFQPIKVGSGESKPASSSFKPKRTFTSETAPKNDMQVGDRIEYKQKQPKYKPKTGKDIYNDPNTFKNELPKKVKEKINNEYDKGHHDDIGNPRLTDVPYNKMKDNFKPRKNRKKKNFYDSNVRKAITASCSMGEPSSKVQGAALQKEKILKHLAEETWKDYDKKEQLVDFLTEKYPDMNKSEVMAVAKTYVYVDIKKKEMVLEKARIDEGLTAGQKKKTRAERKEGFKPYRKEKDIQARSKRVLIDEPKARKENISRIKEKQSKLPSEENLEYPMAASEDEKNVEEMEIDLKKEKPFHGYNKKKHSKKGGLSESYRKKYNRETGSNLKAPVSSKEAKKSPKKAARRKSFCARMSGVKGPTSKEGKLTPKGAALKRWDC